MGMKSLGFHARCANILDETVDVVFQIFLASAGIRGGLALFKHELRKRFKIVLPGLDVGSNTGVPAAVAFVDEVL